MHEGICPGLEVAVVDWPAVRQAPLKKNHELFVLAPVKSSFMLLVLVCACNATGTSNTSSASKRALIGFKVSSCSMGHLS